MTKNYYLGLDIGTESCGWAVTDDKYELLRAKGKDLWGVRLFDEAKTAADRRAYRTSRRRNERAKLKIQWLNEIFEPEISKVDSNFLARLRYSNLFTDDKQKMNSSLQSKNSLFDDNYNDEVFNDKNFYKKYPTIYHLRQELLRKPADDVRFLYLAILNIVKSRGHFLFEGSNVTQNGQLSVLYNELYDKLDYLNNNGELIKNFVCKKELTEADEKELIRINKEEKSKNDKKLKYAELFCADNFSKQITDCLVNGKFNINKFFVVEDGADCKLDFDEENYDLQTKLDEAGIVISDDAKDVLSMLKDFYSILLIKNILGEHNYICESKVASFEKHQKDLAMFKAFIKKYYPNKYFDMFRNEKLKNKTNYVLYVNHDSYDGGKKVLGLENTDRTRESFYKYVKEILSENIENIEQDKDFCTLKEQFLSDMENNNFLPKQRVKENGVLPNQLYVAELKQIIKTNEGKYPFIAAKGKEDYKLVEIIKFRVPYYVGPITQKNNSKNAWATIINTTERLKPWNIENIVDYNKAEDRFIERMLNHCTYVTGAFVLPKHSILYSKYKLLNELNNLMIDGKKPTVRIKQCIFNDLFVNKSGKVGISALIKYLKTLDSEYENITSSSISGIDKGFANNFNEYAKLIENGRFDKNFVDNNIDVFEEIILWNTLISDKGRLEKRIENKYGKIFTSDQIKYLKGLNYSGWGRLSKEFLTLKFIDIKSKDDLGNPKTTDIITELWDTNYNLQEILYESRYTVQEVLNKKAEDIKEDLCYEDVENMYCSPSVKRGVWQTIRIIKELKQVLGKAPEKVFIEVTRHDETKGDAGRKLSRKKTLLEKLQTKELKVAVQDLNIDLQSLINKLDGEDGDGGYDEAKLRSERLYLYFLQLGKCAYSGEPIELEDIFKQNVYDVDHIIPQAIIKDDSIENKVLVKRTYNNEKSDTYPIANFSWVTPDIIKFWQVLKDNHLMTDKKFKNLTRREPLSDEELSGFIARQLVETNQSAKAVKDLLKDYMPEPDTKVIMSKAGFVSAFRDKFEIYKSRSINDLHHAKDAYLNIVVGNVLYSRFTENPKNFYKSKYEDKENVYKDKNKDLTTNVIKLFDSEYVYSPITGEIVWRGVKSEDRKLLKDKGLSTNDYYEQLSLMNVDGVRIKNIALKNSPIVTRLSFAQYNGAYYKETVHKNEKHNPKTEASVSLKGDINNPLSDVKKYGGYNSVNNAYFMVIQSEDEKKKKALLKKYKTQETFDANVKKQEYQKLTIESVPIMVYQKYKDQSNCDELILNEVSKANGLINSQIVVPKLNFKAMFQIGKGYYVLGGKSKESFILHNFNQCFVDNNDMRYIKNIDKFIEIKKLKKLKDLFVMNKVTTEDELFALQDKVIISEPSKFGNKQIYLSKEKNIYLYNLLVEKLNSDIYNKTSFENLRQNLSEVASEFADLSVLNQTIVLNEMIGRFSSGAKLANLLKIGLGEFAGMLQISKNISDKNITLVEFSPTGLYEKRTKLKVK